MRNLKFTIISCSWYCILNNTIVFTGTVVSLVGGNKGDYCWPHTALKISIHTKTNTVLYCQNLLSGKSVESGKRSRKIQRVRILGKKVLC